MLDSNLEEDDRKLELAVNETSVYSHVPCFSPSKCNNHLSFHRPMLVRTSTGRYAVCTFELIGRNVIFVSAFLSVKFDVCSKNLQ